MMLPLLVALLTPGPDSVAVVANANLPGSVALAEDYAEARAVPDNQVCLLDLPETVDLDLEAFQDSFVTPLQACLAEVEPRIEAILLIRGVPLRVTIPSADRADRVSLAAALQVWRSERLDGSPLLGAPPGTGLPCGENTCLSGRWRKPWLLGPWGPGWTVSTGGVHWRPLLVTMLHGRSDADARRLLDSALASEAGLEAGEFLLMRGRDRARGALDGQLPEVAAGLGEAGHEANVVDFDSDLEGRTLAGFVTGTASLGRSIEGNAFLPGSLVDNLTSFGAVPRNFEAEGEQQVSIARWVAQGVAGVHGTTDEPLNNCFPARRFLLDYVAGATLAEAYHRNLPLWYWRNLVLGDPMAAPYADRPEVEAELTEGLAHIRGAGELRIYVEGVEVATAEDEWTGCLPEGRVLVVAKAPGEWPAKGWAQASSDGICPPDAGVDAGLDAGGDAGLDAGVDAAPEPPADAAPEPPADAAPDAAADLPQDAGPEADAAREAGVVVRSEPDEGGCRSAPSGPSPLWLLLAFIRRAGRPGRSRR